VFWGDIHDKDNAYNYSYNVLLYQVCCVSDLRVADIFSHVGYLYSWF
jgi:hypothetical protein